MTPAEGPNLLFVYGSLRRGFQLHSVLAGAGARQVGKGSVGGRLFDLGDYPGAEPSNAAADRVQGEVYRLANPERALSVLDWTEGLRPGAIESRYRRGTTEVKLENGTTAEAWIYWLARWPGPKRLIASGDYSRKRESTDSAD